jgi:hypothetical protein
MRTLRVTRSFLRARERLQIIAGSPEAKALAAELRALCESTALPQAGEERLLLPPSDWVWRRRVAGHGLWVVYAFDEAFVIARTLQRH